MLERWLRLALRDQAMGPACTIYAHLAYRFKNRVDSDLDAVAVYTLQVAQVFLHIHHHFSLDATAASAASSSSSTGGLDSSGPGMRTEGPVAGGATSPRGPAAGSDSGGSASTAAGSTAGRSGDKTGAFEDTGLGIPETEVFDLFQKFRHVSLKWLSAHPAECSEIMENIVKVVTLMGHGKGLAELISGEGLSPDRGLVASGRMSAADLLADSGREWRSLTAHNCFGRFVPDTETKEAEEAAAETSSMAGSSLARAEARGDAMAAAAAASTGESFEAWLRRVTTMGVGTEINVQLGEFTMKKHRMVGAYSFVLMCVIKRALQAHSCAPARVFPLKITTVA